jgi:hypothetical protein
VVLEVDTSHPIDLDPVARAVLRAPAADGGSVQTNAGADS